MSKKITLIGPLYPYRGGIAHFTTLLALKLSEQGHKIQAISFKKQYPNWLYPGKSDIDKDENRLKFPFVYYLLSPCNPITWLNTYNAIKIFNPDKVIIQWWVTFWAPAFGTIARYLRSAGFTVQFIVHNTIPHESKIFDEILAYFALRKGNQFLVMNDQETNRIKDVLGNGQDIIQCSLPLLSIFPDIKVSQIEAKEKLGLPLDKKIFLFFGIVRPYKGLSILLSALEILKNQGVNDWILVVAGEFWDDKEKYVSMIDVLGISNMVIIIDRYISDMEASLYFKSTDLFIAPYSGGTQSASVKTALYFGVPMVLSDMASDNLTKKVPEICYTYTPNAPENLASAILETIKKVKPGQDKIKLMHDKSWQDMIAILNE